MTRINSNANPRKPPTCLTSLTCLNLQNILSPGTLQDPVQITLATELLSGGVDLRTVAGRLGHAGGGATTLKVYAAWVAGADTKAADLIASRLPRPPQIRN
ncbi:MAG: hypothetical protein ACRDSZ_16780 [Pseudonocardiaceae bacterium]